MHGLRRVLDENGWTVAKPGDEYDALVMNGEGSMHHGQPIFHTKMRQLAMALDAGKRAYLVNTVWQENPSDYDEVLRGLSGMTVREVMSQRDLFDRHGITARVIPDLSLYAPLPRWAWSTNFRRNAAITDFYFPDGDRFGRADEIMPEARFLHFRKASWAQAVSSLKTASLLVTGRQHGVYAACRARVPFVASEGNTHKIEGLIRSADAAIPVARNPAEIPAILPRVPELKREYDRLFDWLETRDYRATLPIVAVTS
jgi:hypothetical protein